jgi:hypothetical protein
MGDEVIFEVEVGSGGTGARIREAADFMALAGSVPVPVEWADLDALELAAPSPREPAPRTSGRVP